MLGNRFSGTTIGRIVAEAAGSGSASALAIRLSGIEIGTTSKRQELTQV
jgi:hypothetical protein